MSELARIADQVKRAYEGEGWHGPSVREALEGVDAARAAARPIGTAHSIWEIALHISGWNDVVRRRIAGEEAGEPDEGDWPAVSDASDAAWRRTLDELASRSAALHATVAALDPSALETSKKYNGSSLYETLHGVVHHQLYHAGQIALLKKSEQ